MKKILIVEDDRVVASIYQNKLRNEGYDVEIAEDGESALAALELAAPDLVLLDLGLPKANGIEVLKSIRSNSATKSLPVLVLSNSYVTSLVQAAWKGGANKVLSKSETTPRLLVDVVNGMFSAPLNSPRFAFTGSAVDSWSGPAAASSPAPQPAAVEPPAAAVPPGQLRAASDAVLQSEVRAALLDSAPAFITESRQHLKILGQHTSGLYSPADLFAFHRAVHSRAAHAATAGFIPIAQLSSALEALLKDLHEKPKKIGPSPIPTVAQAIDALAILFGESAIPQSEEDFSPLILILDDEAIARRTLRSSLEKARLRCITVDDPVIALQLLKENSFDLIFSDVDMPGIQGFEFCARVRELPQHKLTPLVFVTGLADFESRARSSLSGGTDLIAKPFPLVELAVKALTYVLRKRPTSSRPEAPLAENGPSPFFLRSSPRPALAR